MNEQRFDGLDRVFSQAQVELPPYLKARLMTIPRMAHPVSFWDPRWMLPIAALLPGVLWLIITRAGAVWDWVMPKVTSLVAGLTIPTLPAPSLFLLAVALGVVVAAAALGAWLYLRAEDQAALIYARRLTGAR
jgi:hypothetical protein